MRNNPGRAFGGAEIPPNLLTGSNQEPISGSDDSKAGVCPAVMKRGEIDAVAWSWRMLARLVKDVPTVKQLIDRIMQEAQSIVSGRLGHLSDLQAAPDAVAA